MNSDVGKTTKKFSPVAISRQRWLKRLTIVLSLGLLHGILFLPLYFFWGPLVSLVIIVPIALSGWFFGTRIGILSAVAGFLYTGVLWNLTGNFFFSMDILAWSAIFFGVCLLVGTIAGQSRQTFRQVNGLKGNNFPDDSLVHQFLYEASITSLITSLNDPAFAIDLDGHIVAWNNPLSSLSSILPENALGKTASAHLKNFLGARRSLLVEYVLSPSPQLSIDYPRCERDGLSLVVEYFIPQQQGAGQYLWTKASPLFDLERNVVGAFQIFRDITEQQLGQEQKSMLTQRDQLSGLYSTSFFDEEVARLDKGDLFPISVLVLSIDLQQYQSSKDGEYSEEDIVRRIASAIYSSFRTSDAAAYLGEGLFGIVLPKADANAVQKANDRLRSALDKRIPNRKESIIKVHSTWETSIEPGFLAETLDHCKQKLTRKTS